MAFTACELRRRSIFRDSEIVEAMLGHLTIAARQHRCVIPVYCFMPDHLHAILLEAEASSRPKGAMAEFKKLSGDWLYENHPHLHWQKDFYDHIIRQSEDWAGQIRYVLANPVKKGLVSKASDWLHSGAIDCDLDETLWYL